VISALLPSGGGRTPAVAQFRKAQEQLTSVLERNFSRGREVMVVIDEAHELKISTLRAVAELLDCPLGEASSCGSFWRTTSPESENRIAAFGRVQ